MASSQTETFGEKLRDLRGWFVGAAGGGIGTYAATDSKAALVVALVAITLRAIWGPKP